MREMKDSGITWLGRIPKDWDLVPVKAVASNKNQKGLYDGVTYIGLEHIESGSGKLLLNDSQNNTEVDSTVSSFSGSDILFGKLRPYLAKVAKPNFDGQCSTEILVLTPSSKIDRNYFFWYLLNPSFIDAINASTYGTKMPRANWEFIGTCPLTLPPFELQKIISDYLDKKCSQVDTLIANVQAQIEKLKAYKQSVITEVVTKGLDPTVPMKDSGVDWMGSIPAVWYPIRLKYLLSVKSGNAIRNELLSDERLVPVYGGGEMIGYTSEANVPVGSILIGRVGARCGCITLPDGIAYATDNALVVNTNVNRKYLYYLLVACNLNRLNTSNAQPLITGGKIREAAVPFTTVDSEQAAIVDFLDRKAAIIDKLITLKQSKIEKLEQYKKSLIYEYVTGKKEVS